jgi:SagB-type dehydrogenase family enzyme
MIYKIFSLSLLFLCGLIAACAGVTQPDSNLQIEAVGSQNIPLPAPALGGEISFEESLQRRRSVREYTTESLELTEISQLLWAAQGITDPSGKRTAPSAGALYPLEIYLAVGNINGLAHGVYRYIPGEHALIRNIDHDLRNQLHAAALKQDAVNDAPVVIIITAVYERTTAKYGGRGDRYVHMEVGAAAQNIYLQAESIDLGTVFIGAFHAEQVKKALQLQGHEQPLGLMPVGKVH